MTIACFIGDGIDPFQLDRFGLHAERRADIIPRCAGHLLGYFLPHEGSHVEAWGVVAFAPPATYEAHRARLRDDAEGRENFAFAARERFIVREERRCAEGVQASFGRAAGPPSSASRPPAAP